MNGMTDQMKDLIGMLPTAPTTYAQLVYNSELLDYQAEQVLLMGDSLNQISPEQMHIKVIDANRAALEAGAQSAMIGYKQLLLNEESLESGLTLLNAVYQSTQNQAANGLATQSQVLSARPVSYTHLRAHETDSYLVCRLLLEKKQRDGLPSRMPPSA